MASIATVVTMGYGTFGSANLLPTLGFGVGAEAAIVADLEAEAPCSPFESYAPENRFETAAVK